MPSTRWIQGRLVPAEEILWLREGMGLHPEWSRKRLARELCLPGQWHEGRGRLKVFAARSFLLKLEAQALLTLPPLRESKRRPRRRGRSVATLARAARLGSGLGAATAVEDSVSESRQR